MRWHREFVFQIQTSETKEWSINRQNKSFKARSLCSMYNIFCEFSILINVQLKPSNWIWRGFSNFFNAWCGDCTENSNNILIGGRLREEEKMRVDNILALVKWKCIQPRAVAISPSGWAIFCIAVGEIPHGKDTVEPNTLTLISRTDTSLRNRGRMRKLLKSDRFHFSEFSVELICH